MDRICSPHEGFCKEIFNAFFDTFVSKCGAPVKFISGNGHCFILDILKALCAKLEISYAFKVPYRPQSNTAEKVNRK